LNKELGLAHANYLILRENAVCHLTVEAELFRMLQMKFLYFDYTCNKMLFNGHKLFLILTFNNFSGMVLGGVSDQVPVFDQPIRKKDAQAMFAV